MKHTDGNTITVAPGESEELRHSPNIDPQAIWGNGDYPSVKRILATRNQSGVGAYGRVVQGCMGASNFLRLSLRTVNIPVETLINEKASHFSPYSLNEDSMLSRGDDIYGLYHLRYSASMSGEDLLIHRTDWGKILTQCVLSQERRTSVAREERIQALAAMDKAPKRAEMKSR